MPEAVACFLHAADLRLDTPFTGGAGMELVLPRMRDILFEALRRLVDCALAREAGFVLLTGALLTEKFSDASACSLRTRFFLIEQMSRLSAAGIACYVEDGGAGFLFERLPLLRPLDEVLETFPLMREAISVSPGTLQGRGMEETGPHGAWWVSLRADGTFEREFLELDALRLRECEQDVSAENRESLPVLLADLKERLRLEADGRSTLLRLKLRGRIDGGSDEWKRDLMDLLNAGEDRKKNFVILDYIEGERAEETALFSDAESFLNGESFLNREIFREEENLNNLNFKEENFQENNFSGEDDLISDFRLEVSSFTSRIDSRLALFDVLKERDLLKRVLADGAAASFLEEISETDMDDIMKDACARLTEEIAEE
ncbi:MAG: hypothetical protein LBT15_05655 [Synergistaceae bacterium]|nr:hypothetical protein [Synergistaceae bacterium]